jgi:tRNA pseudouridine38-40 synthase
LPRYKLTIEYDGTGLVGWQRQDSGPSVQATLEAAAERLDGAPCVFFAAGRTDAGVHATGQVTHVDLVKDLSAEAVRDGLNFWLTREGSRRQVAVVESELVDDQFHARFSAIERRYLYRISNRRSPPVLERGRVWWVKRPLDAAAMHEAAQALVGHHDFTTFRASECQAASPMKTLDVLSISRVADEVHLIAESRSFLHHQVRNMVGTLKLVGEGKWRVGDVRKALEARDRRKGGQTAPPDGLYLTGVSY